MAEKDTPRAALRPFRPLRGLWDLHAEMDRLAEAFPFFSRMPRLIEEEGWPAIDVFEKDGSVIVKADVPGMTAKDIEVTVTEDGLTISGERREEKEVEEKDFYRCERTYGRFLRQVRLPAVADADKAQASFKDGVLEVAVPMKEEAKQRKVEVKET